MGLYLHYLKFAAHNLKEKLKKLNKKKLIVLLAAISICIILPLEIAHGQLAAETWAQIANDWLLQAIDKGLEYLLVAVFLQVILQIILALSNFLLGFAGGLLNWAITLNTSIPLTRCASGVPCIVDTGWVFTRDIANMFFILALVIIAFATILGIESYGMRRLLVPLILIALLLNFSQVFIGVVVDIANVLIETFAKPFRDGFSLVVNGFQQQTATFTNAVGGGMWAFDWSVLVLWNIAQAAIESWIWWLLRSLLLATFNLLLAIILFMLAGIFFLRIPMLWILTIISPFFIVLYLFPYFKSKFRWWLDQTLEWTFIGVFTMFFLYLAYQLMIIMNDSAFKTQWQYTTFRAGLPPEAGGASLESWLVTNILPYIVFVLFLFLAFNFAKQTNAIFAGALVAGAVALQGQIEGRIKGVTRAGVREVKERRPKAISEEREARARERMAKIPIVGGLFAEREAEKLRKARKEKEGQKAVFGEFAPETVVAMSGGKEDAALEVLAEKEGIEKVEESYARLGPQREAQKKAELEKMEKEGLRKLKNRDIGKWKDVKKRYPKLAALPEGREEGESIDEALAKAYGKVDTGYIGKELGKSNIEYLDTEGKLDILFAKNKAGWSADKFRAIGRRDDEKKVAPIIADYIRNQGGEAYLRRADINREDLVSFFGTRRAIDIYGDVLGVPGPTPPGPTPPGPTPPGPTPPGPTPPGPTPPGPGVAGAGPVAGPGGLTGAGPGVAGPGAGAGPPGVTEKRGVPVGEPVKKAEEKVPPSPTYPKKKIGLRKAMKEGGLAAAVGVFTGPIGLGAYVAGRYGGPRYEKHVAPRIEALGARADKWWQERKEKKKVPTAAGVTEPGVMERRGVPVEKAES